MKAEELIRVVDRELDGLRCNIKKIKDRETWTEETEGIFLRFQYEEEALQEIRTILSQMPEEEGEQSGESQKPCEVCSGKTVLYQKTNHTKLFMNTFGESATLVTECNACPPYADCCMKGISANSAFRIKFCPECGRKLTPEYRDKLEKRLREIS